MDKKLMKIVGIVMFAVGLIIFLSNLSITSFTFGRAGITGVVLLLMGIDFILMVVKPNKIFYIIMAVLVLALVVTIIMNMHVYMHRISFFKWLVIALFMFGGIGLTLKGSIQ